MAPVQLKHEDLKDILDTAYQRFAKPDFIPNDPILIPHSFERKEDIEIAGFFAATIAWGQRVTIMNNAKRLMEWMDHSPYEFIIHHTDRDLKRFTTFVHRTFNATDLLYFIARLRKMYIDEGGLEAAFDAEGTGVFNRLNRFHERFFELEYLTRTKKHVSYPQKGSSAKRLNMYLRWMTRPDKEGVDFGIWKSIKSSELMIPLDVHTGTQARKLGLLSRKQDDWKAVEELTQNLRAFDQNDPVKYDFALFGMGVNRLS